jgi:hypothetical protein
MKKLIVTLILICMMLAILSGCVTNGRTPSGSSTSDTNATTNDIDVTDSSNTPTQKKYDKELKFNVAIRSTQVTVLEENNLFDQKIKDEFNMVWDIDYITSEFDQKMRLQFASNDYPEVLVNTSLNLVNELSLTGKLANFENYFDKIPNYLKIWEDVDGGFDYIKEMNKASDGGFYGLVTKRPRKASQTWIYRMGTLSKLGITEMPNTLDALIDLLYKVKEAYPESYPLGTRYSNNPYNGFDFAYGIQTGRYIDPFTNELVPYGAVTDEYREIMKLFKKFYADGIISKEFATMTDTKWLDNYTNGLHFIEFTYGIRARAMNQLMENTDPEAGFEYSLEMVTADPDRGWIYVAELPYFNNAFAFSANLSEEKRERILDFINWACSDEGSWFLSWGVEGITYYLNEKGEPVRHPDYYSAENPNGIPADAQLTFYQDAIFNRVMSAVISVSGDTNIKLSEAFSSNPKYTYFKTIPWIFDPETQSEVNLISSALGEVQKEYMMMFIMGNLDPNNDADWQKYLVAMDKAGMPRYAEISQEYYKNYMKK